MEVDSAMDLSLRSGLSSPPPTAADQVPIVRPIPRPPWSIVWYQNLWSFTSSTPPSDAGGGGGSLQVFPASGNVCAESRNVSSASTSLSILNCLGNSRNSNVNRDGFDVPVPPQPQRLPPLTAAGNNGEFSPKPYLSSFHQWDRRRLEKCAQFKGRSAKCDEGRDAVCSSDDCEDNDENESENSAHIVVSSPGPVGFGNSRASIKSLEASADQVDDGELMDNQQASIVVDIACCDGPVQFKRISNPNFAVTVEHNDVECRNDKSGTPTSTTSVKAYRESSVEEAKACEREQDTNPGSTSLKTYLCIYCNQSFKSLFCYQKHKKRHLNPVSVDITTTTTNASACGSQRAGSHRNSGGGSGASSAATSVVFTPENTKAKTKDLNVQFFPCKKCGCKFPSYYFVHKHRKICH